MSRNCDSSTGFFQDLPLSGSWDVVLWGVEEMLLPSRCYYCAVCNHQHKILAYDFWELWGRSSDIA